MKPYTPTEIIQAGRDQIRAHYAHLYVQLAALRAEAATLYHLAYVDHDAAIDEHGRLPFHPAPAGFGGNELAIPARPVYLNRLTTKGLDLYETGARHGFADVLQLEHEILQAEHDLERMYVEWGGSTAFVAAFVQRGIDIAINRAETSTGRPQSAVAAWDVPVRIPGTDASIQPTH